VSLQLLSNMLNCPSAALSFCVHSPGFRGSWIKRPYALNWPEIQRLPGNDDKGLSKAAAAVVRPRRQQQQHTKKAMMATPIKECV
jgi:hypothetical protein